MFAKRITKTIEVLDGETSGQIVIRKLSFRSLQKVRDVKSADQIRSLKEFGPDLARALRSEAVDEAQRKLRDKRDRYEEYDVYSALVAGIQSWTFDENLPDGIDELDALTATLIFREIIDLSDPPEDNVKQAQSKD